MSFSIFVRGLPLIGSSYCLAQNVRKFASVRIKLAWAGSSEGTEGATTALLFMAELPTGVSIMCDYSLLNVRSRPAKVGDKLTTRDFGTGTRGFAAAEDNAVAVCVLPGTELAFSRAISVTESRFVFGEKVETLASATAIFRQVNKTEQFRHHDALELPN